MRSGKAATAQARNPGEVIRERLEAIREGVAGFDFAEVVVRYWQAFEQGDETVKAAALRLAPCGIHAQDRSPRGPRRSRHRRRRRCLRSPQGDLAPGPSGRLRRHPGGARRDGEPLQAGKLAGADGELRADPAHRERRAAGERRATRLLLRRHARVPDGHPPGLFSYEALRSRLAENSFARNGFVDLSGPVIRLQSLTPDEMLVLLERLRLLWAGGDPARLPVPDEALPAFLRHCSKKIGDDYFRTPRATIRAFLDLLAILAQNSTANWTTLLDSVEIRPDRPVPLPDVEDDLSTFSIAKPDAPPDDGLATFH